jgi:HEAT repeat protein
MKIRFKQNKTVILKLLNSSPSIKKKLKILDRLNGTNEKDNIVILLKILEDTSWSLREKAAYKLAAFGPRVVNRLRKLCERGYWFTRASACLTLGEIGDLKALDVIVKLLLTDDNPTVIKEASQALVKMARKTPAEFALHLQEMELNKPQMIKILITLETIDTEVYDRVKELIENE